MYLSSYNSYLEYELNYSMKLNYRFASKKYNFKYKNLNITNMYKKFEYLK
jgi:hypothetical protein